jgi:ATP-dependent Clp protease adaptor protein ClpS
MTTEVLPDVDTKKNLMPMYRVIIHNDDVNSMDHVIAALQEIFKFEFEQCVNIMLEAHKTGCALCKVEPLEPAELHRDMLQACGLTATIEPE